MIPDASQENELEIADLLDRALYKGVVIAGEATISLAGVDLIYVGLQLVVASADTIRKASEKEQDTMEVH